MKHKTSELTGELLDAAVAVAKCHADPFLSHFVLKNLRYNYGPAFEIRDGLCFGVRKAEVGTSTGFELVLFQPSTNWDDCGPIIDRERIHLTPVDAGGTFNGMKQDRDGWLARCTESMTNERGETPLIAAMRAYVASKLGEEVEL